MNLFLLVKLSKDKIEDVSVASEDIVDLLSISDFFNFKSKKLKISILSFFNLSNFFECFF